MTDISDSSDTQNSRQARPLEGRVAVVIGASSGIGAASARALAAQGAKVVLAARRRERLDQLAEEIASEGSEALAQETDTTDPESLRRLIDRTTSEFGRLDYAVNSAGAPGRAPFLEIPVEQFDQVMNVNLRGVMLAMKAEIPALLASGGGAIVNIASVGGLVGVPGLSAYVASKHAVVGLTKSVALEYATKGIRVNAVAPGSTDTEMLSSGTDEQREYLAGLAPMRRISDPDEIAAAVVYLLVDATYSTGITLAADGGQSVP